jgi:hypothetical protein
MKANFSFALLVVAMLAGGLAAQEKFPPAKVDYAGFARLTDEVMAYRQHRLVDLAAFQRMAAEQGTIVLDTRSESAFQRKHLQGAVHLNFSEFTEEKLAQVIPSKATRVLIYCNNNIEGDKKNFPTKRVELALNIPTFVNLYGYGYRNVHELRELIPADSEAIVLEGTAVTPRIAGK